METVEVVIKISKQTYEYLMNLYKERGMTDFNGYAENAIINGTVLPKGHGNLIDTKCILVKPKYLKDIEGIKMIKLSDLPTIINETFIMIEADREVQDADNN